MKIRAWFLGALLIFGWISAGARAQVVVVGAGSATSAMNREQVTAAFLGKIAGMEPVDLAEGHPLREDFYVKALGKSTSQVKSYWAKLLFTGKGTPPREYSNSADVKRALAANPNAIGYIEKSSVDASVKVVFEGTERRDRE